MEMARPLLCFVAVLAIFGLCSSCPAQIVRSRDSVVGIREGNLNDLLVEHGLVPKDLKGRQVCLMIRLGGAYAEVIACADNAQDPRPLADLIAKGAGMSDVQYSQDDGCSAAFGRLSFGRLFTTDRRWSFDCESVVRAFRQDGWTVYGGIRVEGDATDQIVATAVAHSSRNSIYRFSDFESVPVPLHAHIGIGTQVLPFVVVCGPFAILLACFGAGTVVAKRKTLDLESRRRIFQSLTRRLIYLAMALCLAVSLSAIFLGWLDPVSDLWFGASSNMPLIVAIFPMMPIPILLLIPMSRVEARLFSDSADKPKFQAAKVMPLSKPSARAQAVIAVVFFAIGFVLIQLSIFAVPRASPLRMLFTLAGYAAVFGAMPLAGLLVARNKRLDLAAQSDDPVVKRALEFAGRLRVPLAVVSVIEPGDQRRDVSVRLYAYRLMVSRHAIDGLSSDVLDFGIVYALTSRAYRMLLAMFACIVPLAAIFAGAQVWAQHHMRAEQRPLVLLGGVLLIFIPVRFLVPLLQSRDSLRQIRESLATIPSRRAAVEWMESSLDGPQQVVRASMLDKHRRLVFSQIEQVADEMGLA